MTNKMLGNAYALADADETREFYDAWADAYDAEINENGYATPARCAMALARFACDPTAPLLDIGCGTGLSGAALKTAGFTTLDGCDFSAEMLARAANKGIYRALLNTNLEDPFPFDKGTYEFIAAVGVLNPGHAPAGTIDTVLELLGGGDLFVFSLNDHALADKAYEARINENVDCGNASVLFREYGDHLPDIGLKSVVYVLRKS